ncbi:hypothetical protein Glove_341g34 [Diversispora epigaea]|uniref:Uncharacterized protein n=1 Tax=Diversispora epigaea TaxID=1348612 RepID=A0A397HLZ0_9GLOM|nr:hypothetical protein Glove_341g34 [Diversispora epigaea]
MEDDIFEETTEVRIFGNFSLDESSFIEKNKYDVVNIRMLTCKRLNQELSKDELNEIINKMSGIFEVHIISTIRDTDYHNDISKDPIISSLLMDVSKLAKLYAAFSTEIAPSENYGMIDLRSYKLSGINTSLLNAGIFSRAGNQVRLSQIINQFDFLNNTSFIEEYNKRIKSIGEMDNIFNIIINAMAFNLTPFGGIPTTFDTNFLDKDLSFVQLIYRNLGGDDMKKQGDSDWFDPATLPNLKEIYRNSIQFIALDDRKLIFRYENGTMTITKLYVHPHWIETFWNIVMLEMRSKCEPIVGSIANFYSGVIKSEEDFDLAYQLGIIHGGPMNFKDFREIMYKISEISHYNSTYDASLHVKNLVSKVKVLQKNGLLQLYLISGENVWIRFINISAIIVLFLTVLQTVISVLSYKVSIEQSK